MRVPSRRSAGQVFVANLGDRGDQNGEDDSDVADDNELRWMRAEARSLAWIHMCLVTSPTSFVIRYCNQDFLWVYWSLRGKGSTLKLMGYLCSLFLIPWVCARCMGYPCRQEEKVILGKASSVLNASTLPETAAEIKYTGDKVVMQGTHCEVEDWLRSAGSITIGPGCLLLCLLIMLPFSQSQHYGLVFRFMLRVRYLISAVPYNGLGPRLAMRGTGGQTAQSICKGKPQEQELSPWNDLCGAPDIYLFIVLFNGSLMMACVVVPACFGYVKHGLSGMVSGCAIAVSIALVLYRVVFQISNSVLGAPSALLYAVDQEIMRRKLPFKDGDPGQLQAEFAKAVEVAEKLVVGPLAKGEWELDFLLGKLKKLHGQHPPDFFAGIESTHTQSLLRNLSDCVSDTMALTRVELSALAWMNPVGIVFGLIDPDYLVLGGHPFHFQKSSIIRRVCITDRDTILAETGGVWKEEDSAESSDQEEVELLPGSSRCMRCVPSRLLTCDGL